MYLEQLLEQIESRLAKSLTDIGEQQSGLHRLMVERCQRLETALAVVIARLERAELLAMQSKPVSLKTMQAGASYMAQAQPKPQPKPKTAPKPKPSPAKAKPVNGTDNGLGVPIPDAIFAMAKRLATQATQDNQ
jgi:hypothetical protein